MGVYKTDGLSPRYRRKKSVGRIIGLKRVWSRKNKRRESSRRKSPKKVHGGQNCRPLILIDSPHTTTTFSDSCVSRNRIQVSRTDIDWSMVVGLWNIGFQMSRYLLSNPRTVTLGRLLCNLTGIREFREKTFEVNSVSKVYTENCLVKGKTWSQRGSTYVLKILNLSWTGLQFNREDIQRTRIEVVKY